MTTFFSSYYTPDGINQTSLPVRFAGAPSAETAGRIRYKRAYFDLTSSTVDLNLGNELRCIPIKSSDRLLELLVSNTDFGGVTITLDFGLFHAGENHDGDVIDNNYTRNMFRNKLLVATTISNRLETLAGSASRHADEDRGKAAWELVNVSAVASGGTAPYAEDPKEAWEICATPLLEVNTGGELLVELLYVDGGG